MSKRDFLDPNVTFHIDNIPVVVNGKSSTVLDFWKWSFSMLEDNIVRGTLGQYIVAWAIGSDNIIRNNLQEYDLISPHGKKIEVKTTAYAQIWKHGENNRTPLFIIKPNRSYIHEVVGLIEQKIYNADIYVLCYYSWKESKSMDMTNIRHWKFWVFSLLELQDILKGKERISVKRLETLGYKPLNAFQLRDAILIK